MAIVTVFESCPVCRIGDLQPIATGYTCDYCASFFSVLPSEALHDEYWTDQCSDCGGRMTFVKPVAGGELYWCENCSTEHVRPLPFCEEPPPLTKEQIKRLYQGGGNE